MATGRMVADAALSDDPAPFSNKLSSLRIGRGLAGSAMDGTGILGADRTGLMTGSDPLENFRTSEGLSRRLLGSPWPLFMLLLDSFQLRRWIEGLVGVLVAPFPTLPAPPLPFSC